MSLKSPLSATGTALGLLMAAWILSSMLLLGSGQYGPGGLLFAPLVAIGAHLAYRDALDGGNELRELEKRLERARARCLLAANDGDTKGQYV